MPYLVIPRDYSLTPLGIMRLAGIPVAQYSDQTDTLMHMRAVQQETGEMPRCYYVSEMDPDDMGIMTLGQVLERARKRGRPHL